MTTKKKAKVVPLSNEQESRNHYRIKTATHAMTQDELIDWLAQIAYDEQDWGWIRRELNRREKTFADTIVRMQRKYDDLWSKHYADLDKLRSEVEEAKRVGAENLRQDAETIQGLERQIDELEEIAKVCHTADLRAIEMWREANPGNDRVWPDAARLAVWLMERLIEAEQDAARAKAELLKD